MYDPTRFNPRSYARFMAKVQVTESCWLWGAAISDEGNGWFWSKPRPERAHRWSYMFHKGAIPDGLVLDHLCRVRHCVNPDHLEPVTILENVSRGAVAHRFCRKGHAIKQEDLIVSGEGRSRRRNCPTCKKLYVRKPRRT